MNLLEAAEDFEIAGLNPLPLRENKSPYLPSPHPYLYEPFNDFDRFKHEKCKKIGVACGKISDNLYCFDFDCKNKENIKDVMIFFGDNDYFKLLVKKKLVAVYKTPSGGYHVICKSPEPKKSTHYAKFETGAIMIESKGEGGYIVCAPSEGYEHLRGAEITELNKLTEDEFDFLEHRATICNQYINSSNQNNGKNSNISRDWPEKWDNETPDGRYNNECFDEAIELLIERGWQYSKKKNPANPNIIYLTREGKDADRFVSGSIGFRKNMFYCFTSSDNPFEASTAYTAFGILTICSFNGDWKKAKDYCAEKFGMQKLNYPPKKALVIPEDLVPEPGDFPLDIFPKDWQYFIAECQEALNFSPDFMAVSMIQALAASIGNNLKVRVKNSWVTPPIFWFAVVSTPGSIKSHPLSLALSPLSEIDKNAFNDYRVKFAEYEILDEKEKKKEKKPHYKQIIIKDTTLEALCQVLGYTPRGLLLYKDELVGLFKSMNQYRKGSDEEFWLESFNNKSITINRVTKEPVFIENVFVGIIGTIQDDVLADLAKNKSDNGFLDRFLFTKPAKKVVRLSKNELSAEALNWWNRFIKNCFFEFDTETILVDFNDNAFERYMHYDDLLCQIEENNDDIEQGLKKYVAKLKTYFPRFCLIMNVLDLIENGVDLKIDVSHVDKSYKMIEYFFATARKIFVEQRQKGEINEFLSTLKGKTNIEKIVLTMEKYPNLSQKQVADMLSLTRVYVNKVVNQNKKVNKKS